jgi:hypothetical protein
VYVIDGDTINVFHVQPNVRLAGFNAPDVFATVLYVIGAGLCSAVGSTFF